MRKNFAALGLACAVALTGAAAVPAPVLADEPSPAVNAAAPAATGLALPQDAVENDSLGNYADPMNPVDVQLSYSARGRLVMAYINGVNYQYNDSFGKEPYWTANVRQTFSYDAQGQKTDEEHVPARKVVIPETINGAKVTSVYALASPCEYVVLNSNIKSYSGASANLRALVLANPNVRFSGNWELGISAEGAVYLPEELSPCDLDAVGVYVGDAQVNGAGSDCGDIKGLVPYLRVGTPEASDPLKVDDKQMFAYRMRGDSAEVYCCVYNDKYTYFNFKNVTLDSHIDGVPVTSIGTHAISTCKGSNWGGQGSTLVIPETVREIKSDALVRARFETVVLDGELSLEVIGDGVFGGPFLYGGPLNFGPKGSEGIVIPASVKSIGAYAFRNTQATSVTFEDGCAAVLDPDAFGGTRGSNITTVVAPSTVTVSDGASFAEVFPKAGMGEDGTPKKVTVSFDAAGVDPMRVEFGANLSAVELPTPVRAGYAFSRWVLKEDGSDIGAHLVTADVELAAVWTLAAPRVTVSADIAKPVTGDTVKLSAKVEHPLLAGGAGSGATVAYAWTKDGKAIDGVSASSLKVSEAGSYAVEVTITDAAGLTTRAASDPVSVSFSAPVAGEGDASDKGEGLPATGDLVSLVAMGASATGAVALAAGIASRKRR